MHYEVGSVNGHPAALSFNGSKSVVLATFYGDEQNARWRAHLFISALRAVHKFHAEGGKPGEPLVIPAVEREEY